MLFDRVQRPEFRALMQRVVEGAAVLARGIASAGVPLFTGGTDTHMVVVDLRRSDWKERDINAHLERHGVIGNTTTLPSQCPATRAASERMRAASPVASTTSGTARFQSWPTAHSTLPLR